VHVQFLNIKEEKDRKIYESIINDTKVEVLVNEYKLTDTGDCNILLMFEDKKEVPKEE
jgi:hypothetical protein